MTEKNTMAKVFEFIKNISIDVLASFMYSTSPNEPIPDSFLTSGQMSEWYKFMAFLARSLLTPTTQTSKIPHQQAALVAYFCDRTRPLLPAEYYIFQAIKRASAPQRLSSISSLVFPATITLLCLMSGVEVHNDDAIALPVSPVNRVTIAKSATQTRLYVESLEQTLLKKEMKLIVNKAMADAIQGFRDYIGKEFADFKAQMPGMLASVARRLDEDTSGSSSTPSQDSSPSSSDASDEDAIRNDVGNEDEDLPSSQDSA